MNFIKCISTNNNLHKMAMAQSTSRDLFPNFPLHLKNNLHLAWFCYSSWRIGTLWVACFTLSISSILRVNYNKIGLPSLIHTSFLVGNCYVCFLELLSCLLFSIVRAPPKIIIKENNNTSSIYDDIFQRVLSLNSFQRVFS